MKNCHKLSILLSLLSFLLLQNCNTIAFLATPSHTPFIKNGDLAKASVALTAATDPSSSYNIVGGKIAMGLAPYRSQARTAVSLSLNKDAWEAEGMAGLGTNNFEIYGGYGFSKTKHASYAKAYLYSAKVHRLFMQFGYLHPSEVFSLGFYSRLIFSGGERTNLLTNLTRKVNFGLDGLMVKFGPILRIAISKIEIETKVELAIGLNKITQPPLQSWLGANYNF